MRPLSMRGVIFPKWVLATGPFRISNLYYCLPEVDFVCLVCYLFLCSSPGASSNSQRPPHTHTHTHTTNTPLPVRTFPPSIPPTHPFFVNTDYVCGLSQTLFVKLRILQQNIFGDKCCTVFVSSIFVYCYFEENNMHFIFLCLSFFGGANFMFIHFKNCCM